MKKPRVLMLLNPSALGLLDQQALIIKFVGNTNLCCCWSNLFVVAGRLKLLLIAFRCR